MTSKEALQHIINVLSDDCYYMDLLEEEFEVLEKDLKLLDRLKSELNRKEKEVNE